MKSELKELSKDLKGKIIEDIYLKEYSTEKEEQWKITPTDGSESYILTGELIQQDKTNPDFRAGYTHYFIDKLNGVMKFSAFHYNIERIS
jgi:hypothetical protein